MKCILIEALNSVKKLIPCFIKETKTLIQKYDIGGHKLIKIHLTSKYNQVRKFLTNSIDYADNFIKTFRCLK